MIAKEIEVYLPPIVGGDSISGNYSYDPPGHTLSQSLYAGRWYFLPLRLQVTGQFSHQGRTVGGTPLVDAPTRSRGARVRVKFRALRR